MPEVVAYDWIVQRSALLHTKLHSDILTLSCRFSMWKFWLSYSGNWKMWYSELNLLSI